jgi:hypothetical protein
MVADAGIPWVRTWLLNGDADYSTGIGTAAGGGSTFVDGSYVKVKNEITRIKAISGNTLTVARAQQGTSALADIGPYDLVLQIRTDSVQPGSAVIDSSTGTTLDVAAGPDFQAGQVIQIRSECMTITGVAGNELTVTRGTNEWGNSAPAISTIAAGDVVVVVAGPSPAAMPLRELAWTLSWAQTYQSDTSQWWFEIGNEWYDDGTGVKYCSVAFAPTWCNANYNYQRMWEALVPAGSSGNLKGMPTGAPRVAMCPDPGAYSLSDPNDNESYLDDMATYTHQLPDAIGIHVYYGGSDSASSLVANLQTFYGKAFAGARATIDHYTPANGYANNLSGIPMEMSEWADGSALTATIPSYMTPAFEENFMQDVIQNVLVANSYGVIGAFYFDLANGGTGNDMMAPSGAPRGWWFGFVGELPNYQTTWY